MVDYKLCASVLNPSGFDLVGQERSSLQVLLDQIHPATPDFNHHGSFLFDVGLILPLFHVHHTSKIRFWGGS